MNEFYKMTGLGAVVRNRSSLEQSKRGGIAWIRMKMMRIYNGLG